MEVVVCTRKPLHSHHNSHMHRIVRNVRKNGYVRMTVVACIEKLLHERGVHMIAVACMAKSLHATKSGCVRMTAVACTGKSLHVRERGYVCIMAVACRET